MAVVYKVNAPLSTEQFIDVLVQSTLGARRPVADRECMEGMVANSNLLVTAWSGVQLVGVARGMTDFHYACYVSDLAVISSHQRRGIGRGLLSTTQAQLGIRCKLILIAAPAADDYYATMGFSRNPRCWVLERDQQLDQLP